MDRILISRCSGEPKYENMTLKLMQTAHFSSDDMSTTVVQARGSNETKGECRSSCTESEL